MSMWSSSSRTLAPAPPPTTGGLPESAPSSPGSSLVNHAAAIKRASTACQSCKQIKRKCDQAQPCSNCVKSHTPCVYDETRDGRRKAARKRSVESLELKRDALDSILDSLRTSDDHHVQTLVRLIRSHAPLEEIVKHATIHAENLPGQHVQKIATVAHGKPRKTVLSVNDLCDTPLVRVPAKPWTTVTDNDEFVSHLISIYFTWYHVAYPVLDKELFLQDMQAGNVDCQFCSPLLVNSILTIACHFSDHPRTCQVVSDPSSRGRHFLEEGIRLWNEQELRPTLLNVQALSILAVATTLVGKDRLGKSYVQQMNKMQLEYTFKITQAEARGSQPLSSQLKLSQYLTSWTTFLLTVGYGAAFMEPSLDIVPATMSFKDGATVEPRLRWFPYPYQTPAVTFPFGALFEQYCRLHEIGLDIHRLCFGENRTTHAWEVRNLNQRLHEWKCNLPDSLLPSIDSSVIKPPIMDLHLTFYWFHITLFNFIKAPDPGDVAGAGELDLPGLNARSQVIESARSITDLYRQYARDFGLKQLTMWMPQTSVSAAYSLIDELSDPVQGDLLQETFYELCLVLVAASQRWLVMKGHVRMLFVTAEERGQKLSSKTKSLLGFVALDKWGEKDHLRFASASYPNYALAKDEDPRLTAMGDLLEKWATFRAREEAVEEILVANDPVSPSSNPLYNNNDLKTPITDRESES